MAGAIRAAVYWLQCNAMGCSVFHSLAVEMTLADPSSSCLVDGPADAPRNGADLQPKPNRAEVNDNAPQSFIHFTRQLGNFK